MNGAPRPHHRNIYCIIYSAGPQVQGERTHINFLAPLLLTQAPVCCSKQRRPLALLLLFFRSFSLLHFLPARGASIGTPRPSHRPAPAADAVDALIFIFLLALSCFSVFVLFSCNWSNTASPKDYKQEITGILRDARPDVYKGWRHACMFVEICDFYQTSSVGGERCTTCEENFVLQSG